MSEHKITLNWKKQTESFEYEVYNRDHLWDFGEGLIINASSAPEFMGNPEYADPERAFAAALSSCHMLFFIAICSKKKLVVQGYTDNAVAYLEKNDSGSMVITRVILKPKVEFAEEVDVDREAIEKIHHQAHKRCFLANSVRSEIIIEPVWA